MQASADQAKPADSSSKGEAQSRDLATQRSEQAINPRVEKPGEAAAGRTVNGGRVEPVLRRAASGRRRRPGRRRGRLGLPRGRRGRGRRGPHAPRGAAQSLAHGPPAAASGRWPLGTWDGSGRENAAGERARRPPRVQGRALVGGFGRDVLGFRPVGA